MRVPGHAQARALCATLPLFVSPRQYRHYLLPAMPFFAIALAMMVQPRLPGIKPGYWWTAAGILAAAALVRTAMFFGEPGVDKTVLLDVQQIAAATSERDNAYPLFCKSQPDHQAYLARHHGIRSAVGTDGDLVICATAPRHGRWRSRSGLSSGLQLWQRQPERTD